MSEARTFIDTNVLLYLVSSDLRKAGIAETLLTDTSVISVQVLNEFTAVSIRKLRHGWTLVDEALSAVRSLVQVEPLTVETHDLARRIAQAHRLSVYDACILAAAQLADCAVLYSEDMQAGFHLPGGPTIRNPFVVP
jgi:predicted nucleic acid-binding protein